jgi:hypothetical protein
MVLYQSPQPGIEVRGEYVIPMIDSAGPFQETPLKILAENGIVEPQPGQWYPLQAYLNAIKTVASKLGPATLFLIGKWMAEDGVFPQGINNIDTALAALDKAYNLNHRGGNCGSYEIQKASERSYRVICQSPYPEDVDRGLIEALLRKHKTAGILSVQVKIDTSLPSKSKGAETSTIVVSW